MRSLGALLFVGALSLSACIIRPNPNGSNTTAGPGGNPALIVANRSSTTICFVNFSLSSDGNWGGDQLGSSETIGAGASRAWNVSAGDYDVRLMACDRTVLSERRGVVVRGPTQVAYP